MDTIYRKYPKVKEKYDGLARMWESLPTHAQVIALQGQTEDEMVRERDEDESMLISFSVSFSLKMAVNCFLYQALLLSPPSGTLHFVKDFNYHWKRHHLIVRRNICTHYE